MLDHTISDRLNAAYASIIRMDAGEITREYAERLIIDQNLPQAVEALVVGALRAAVDCRENFSESERKSVDGGAYHE